MMEQAIVFYLVHIGQRFLFLTRRTGSTAFTAISCDERTAVVKGIDRKEAVVGAQPTVAD